MLTYLKRLFNYCEVPGCKHKRRRPLRWCTEHSIQVFDFKGQVKTIGDLNTVKWTKDDYGVVHLSGTIITNKENN